MGTRGASSRPNVLTYPQSAILPSLNVGSVSLRPQQELARRHVPGCHGADWLVVKLELTGDEGKCSFQNGLPYYVCSF